MTDETFRLNVQVPLVVVVYEKKRLKQVIRAAGKEVAAVSKSMIATSVGSGRIYGGSGGSKYRPKKKGAYQASSPGQPPVNVTGLLNNSTTTSVFPSGEGVAIRQNMFYALFLAKGAKGPGRRVLLARPSLAAALDKRASSIEERVKESVLLDIAFKRLKP